MIERQTTEMKRLFIAGAGPVGLAAAVELRRRGLAPRIVDPDPEPSPESRALAVNPRTLELLEPSGVTAELLARGHRLRAAIFRYRSEPLMAVDLTLIPHRFNFLLSLAQWETERILTAAFESMGGRVERGAALAGFTAAENGIALRLGDGAAASCDFLIGADGARSLVRKTLGIGFPGESEPQAFGLADVELDAWPFPWDRLVATLRDDHIVAFIPMREGFGRFVSSRPDTMNVLPPEARPRRVAWESVFRISYRQASTYQKGGVFLAGDAAHIHSPVGGRGMNLGIEDACWLAWLIETGRTADYTALRHPVGAAVLRMTAVPTGFIVAKSWAARMARRWIVPFVFGRPAMQRRILPALTALNTPPPPWL
jgi:2-polyprenyl-6-methoxyphenol hydroxylase-like FAD-dependent oxidoreductase